jgi:cytochrome c553
MVPQAVFHPNVYREISWSLLGRSLVLLALAIPAIAAQAEVSATNSAEVEQGRRIYMEGVLPSGTPLKGQRQESGEVEGAVVACTKCHRASGMGGLEGNIVAPPITGGFLFANTENRPLALLDVRAPKNVTRAHAPYTSESLGKAIREGINVSGGKMNPLMPHYSLNDVEIKALTAYLQQLSAQLPPGVGEDTLHFATIVTPGVDAKQRDVLVSMMQKAFEQRNASQQSYSGRMRMPLDLIPRTLRNWKLSVWELQGTPDTWAAQLAENYRKEPVFAVVSGISNSTWAPVHEFCKQEKVPCMLPSTVLPPVEEDFYSMYFSRGVVLEAGVLAKRFREQGDKAPRRLVQVYRDDEVGRSAAKELNQALHDSGIKIEDRILHSQDKAELSAALKDVSGKDGVMLWLRPADLIAVNKVASKQSPAVVYVSGFLAEENYSMFTKSWKPQIRVLYPYELGVKHKVSVETMQKWLKAWGLPLVNEAFQTEVYFNLLFLTDLSSQMLDNLYRDYLLERAEDMMSWGSNISIYPSLSMAPGQRFASKGAYIARFAKDGKLVADSEWLVP